MSLLIKGLLGGIAGGSQEFIKKLHDDAEQARQVALQDQRFAQSKELAGINFDNNMTVAGLNQDRADARSQQQHQDRLSEAQFKLDNQAGYADILDDKGNIIGTRNLQTKEARMFGSGKGTNKLDEIRLRAYTDRVGALMEQFQNKEITEHQYRVAKQAAAVEFGLIEPPQDAPKPKPAPGKETETETEEELFERIKREGVGAVATDQGPGLLNSMAGVGLSPLSAVLSSGNDVMDSARSGVTSGLEWLFSPSEAPPPVPGRPWYETPVRELLRFDNEGMSLHESLNRKNQ